VTPYELAILTHYYVSPSEPKHIAITELFESTVLAWLDDGTLKETTTPNVFTLTDRSRAWVKAILNTPVPRLAYLDQRDEEITL